jgi:hypothetical protein
VNGSTWVQAMAVHGLTSTVGEPGRCFQVIDPLRNGRFLLKHSNAGAVSTTPLSPAAWGGSRHPLGQVHASTGSCGTMNSAVDCPTSTQSAPSGLPLALRFGVEADDVVRVGAFADPSAPVTAAAAYRGPLAPTGSGRRVFVLW